MEVAALMTFVALGVDKGGVLVGVAVGEEMASITVAGACVARPAFPVTHSPKPVREAITPMSRIRTSPVKINPPAVVG
jgi:hypothetical protein